MGSEWTYQQRRIRCGKTACGRCAGGVGHGPYWYGFRRRNGRVESKYFGKRDPRPARRHEGPMTYKAALRVFDFLRLRLEPTAGQVRSQYLRLAKRHHPDTGGDTRRMQRVNAAYEVLRRQHGGAGA